MSTDYFASGYDIISEDDIKKVVPEAFEAFVQAAKKLTTTKRSIDSVCEIAFDTYAAYLSDEDDDYEDRVTKEIKVALHPLIANIRDAFAETTGLRLYVSHVGEGLRGSDITDWTFWHIDNAMITNPALVSAAEKYDIVIPQRRWHLGCG